jgi:two-component system, NtrC family, response regulator HydG
VNSKETAILLVDDHKETATVLRTFFGMCLKVEHNCVIAASAEEAMRLLEASFFHLVLSDIQLPGMSGLELCSHVNETYPNTVVIMVSGMTDIKYAIEAMRSGAFDYLTKPVNPKEFLASVERALKYQEALMTKHYCEQSLEEEVNDLLALNNRIRSAMKPQEARRFAAGGPK